MQKDRIQYIAIRSLRFCIAASLFALISVLAHKVLIFSRNIVDYTIEEQAISIVRVVLNLLLYYSVLRSFLIADLAVRNRYFTKENEQKSRFLYLVQSDAFWVCLIGTLFFVLLFPGVFGMAELHLLGFSAAACRWILIAAYLLWVPVIDLSAIREWDTLEEEGKLSKKPKRVLLTLLGNIGWTFAAYIGIAFFCPLLLPAVYSTGRILHILGWKALGILLAVVLAIFAAIGFRAFRIRRKFVIALRKAAETNGWKLSKITAPYLSLFFDHTGSSFTLKAHGKVYTCKMLAGIRRGNPIRFLGNGQCMIIHRIRIRHVVDDIMQFHTQFPYAFEGGGKKILIMSPTPYKMFIADGKENHLLDIGDSVGAYTIFTGTSFINAIKRDCI